MSIFGWTLWSLSAACFLLYSRQLLLWRKGMLDVFHTDPGKEERQGGLEGVSIVVPVRNEDGRWEALWQDLQDQLEVLEESELLFVDDHSEDGSKEALRKTCEGKGKVRFLELDQEKWGKKQALFQGIRAARYEWILSLDADVRLGRSFLNELMRRIEERKAELHLLPVLPFEAKGPFQHMLYYEALALLGILIGSAGRNEPLLANGAGMVFKRSTFFQEGAYQGHLHIDSGDDLFLLQDWHRKGKKIEVLPCASLLVRTRYPQNLTEWVDQRLRWASKSRGFKEPKALRSMALMGGMNLLLLFDLLLLFSGFPIFLIIMLWAFKGAIDRIFLTSSLQRLGKGFSWKYFPLALFLYPFQLMAIPFMGLFRKPLWKGRRIQDH